RELGPLFNTFELDRDPGLRKKIGPVSPFFSSEVQATAFLARMIERDAEGLKMRPHSRAAKWKNHLSETGCPLPTEECIDRPDGLRNHILNCIFDRISSPYSPERELERASFQSALVSHLERMAVHQEPDYAQGFSPWLYSLYTHRYCGADPAPELSLK